MKGKMLLPGIAAGFGLAMMAHAHHAFAPTYDESQEIRVEGRLDAFHFRNPHSQVDVRAPGENGDSILWEIEWGGAGQLSGQGLSEASLRAGDHLVITGNPARDPNAHRLRLQSLLRPVDGFGWGFLGESFD